MLTTFERFAQQEYISDAQKDAFARSHPLSTDRLARLRTARRDEPLLRRQGYPRAAAAPRPDARQAVRLPGQARRSYSIATRPATRRCRHAMRGPWPASSREARARSKRRSPTSMASSRRGPTYPYFWEVKGDLLMRAGKTHEAIPSATPSAEARPLREPHSRAARRRPAGGSEPGGHHGVGRSPAQVAD